METFAPIFRRINTSGGIFRYDSCSSFLFSGGCFTCAINPIPDRFAATRWAYARITFRRIFFNMESATIESVGVQVIGMQFHATAGLHKGARNPTWRESKQSTAFFQRSVDDRTQVRLSDSQRSKSFHQLAVVHWSAV